MFKIRKLCKERGIIQKDLANALDVSERTITNAIRGDVSIQMLHRIANALGVKVPELFEDQPEPEIRCPHCGARLELNKKEVEPLDLFSQK
jgi:transcriptional regulator with XRE-family HTH domain